MVVMKSNLQKKKSKRSVLEALQQQWKVLFDYDSTPQQPPIKAWCTFTPPPAGTDGAVGRVIFEQLTTVGTEVVPRDLIPQKLRDPTGVALGQDSIKANTECQFHLDGEGWVMGCIGKKSLWSERAITVLWKNVTVTIKYDVSGLSLTENVLRIQPPAGGPVLEATLVEPDADGSSRGQFETKAIRLEETTGTPNIVGMNLHIVEIDDAGPVIRAEGDITNTFSTQAGNSEVVALMQKMDGPESGNRQYYESRNMTGAAREGLRLSPALTDVDQTGDATAQVRATLLAFNKAWAGNGGRLDEHSLQLCFRVLMQTTGVRVHQLFELHSTPNYERGRDRRCWGSKKSKKKFSGVAFTQKVADALIDPKSLCTEVGWEQPLLQLRKKKRNMIPLFNLASVACFLYPLLVLLLHIYVFDKSRGFPLRTVFYPLDFAADTTLSCCSDWVQGDIIESDHVGNMSGVDSIGACCNACDQFPSWQSTYHCSAAVYDEAQQLCYFYDTPVDFTDVQPVSASVRKYTVAPRSTSSRAFDWYVHKLGSPVSLLVMLLLWIWTLGPDYCRMRRSRTGAGGKLPRPLHWLRCWGISFREVMNFLEETTLYVDEDFVDEALVQLLEEAEERRRLVGWFDFLTV